MIVSPQGGAYNALTIDTVVGGVSKLYYPTRIGLLDSALMWYYLGVMTHHRDNKLCPGQQG